MMPKPHFSWSQFDCYQRDPGEYFTRYVVGAPVEETPAMRLGSLVHKAIETRAFQWRKELVRFGFTPDYARGIEKALPQVPKPSKREVLVKVPFPKFETQLMAYFDGLDPDTLFEWKTGNPWTQKRVEEHEQLDMYALIHRMKYGKVPKRIVLVHINCLNGKVTEFETFRSVKRVETFRKTRLEPTMQLIDREVFHRV